MRAITHIDVNTVELSGALEFTAVRTTGWAELLIAASLAMFVVWLFWRTGGHFIRVVAGIAVGIGSLSLVSNWVQGGVTRLRVTGDELIAKGNLRRWFPAELHIPAAKVTSIYWDPGADSDSGLYVRHGWKSECVLPGITEEQARAIRAAIARNFPEIEIGATCLGSFLFGSDSGITTLGISVTNRTEKESDKRR